MKRKPGIVFLMLGIVLSGSALWASTPCSVSALLFLRSGWLFWHDSADQKTETRSNAMLKAHSLIAFVATTAPTGKR